MRNLFLVFLVFLLTTSAAFAEANFTTIKLNSTTAGSQLNMIAGDPGAPTEGQTWYDTTNRRVRFRANAASRSLYEASYGFGLTAASASDGLVAITVTAGDGITVTAGGVEVLYGVTANTAVEGDQTATVGAGAGLTGGVSADALGNGFSATLDIGAGTGITVNADDIAINLAANLTWTGYETFANASVAGLTLTATDDGLRLNKVAGTPSAVEEGEFWYDDTANALKYRDDSTVRTVHVGGGTTQIGQDVFIPAGTLSQTITPTSAFADANYTAVATLDGSTTDFVMLKTAVRTASTFDVNLESNPNGITVSWIAHHS